MNRNTPPGLRFRRRVFAGLHDWLVEVRRHEFIAIVGMARFGRVVPFADDATVIVLANPGTSCNKPE